MSNEPNYKKYVICALRRKYVYYLNKLCSGMSYSDVVHELNVNESVVYIKVFLNRNTHKIKFCVNQLMKILCQRLRGT